MREELAEQLLCIALDWDVEIAKEEIANLRYLAAFKYDGYQNFEPGYRFFESLVLWLGNFNTVTEKQVAYNFMKKRMLYFSETQMHHLVALLYPQRVVPILREQTRQKDSLSPYEVNKIIKSTTFQIYRRKSLFFGMSDGARMDSFRRKHALNNEQVCVSYELSPSKLDELYRKLKEWIEVKGLSTPVEFENIFLIDDFSGSGNSILMLDNGIFKGKLQRFITDLFGKDNKLGKYCGSDGPNVYIVTYIGTEKSVLDLRKNIEKLKIEVGKGKFRRLESIEPLQLIANSLTVPQSGDFIDADFEKLINNYYDDRLQDKNTDTGGPDVKHGYAQCSLPLVLCHNCPNNSIYLLWGQTEKNTDRPGLKALFPRISRHLESRD